MSSVGSREQLLVPVGTALVSLNLWLIEPQDTARGTVVFIHDFDGNGVDFASVAAFLADWGYRVVCPDMPGRGQSACIPSGQATVPGMVAALGAVLAHDSVGRRSTVVGCGWGAAIALATLGGRGKGLAGFVACDLPLDLTMAADSVLTHALMMAGRTFATEKEACNAVLASPAFVGSALQPADVVHRVRRHDSGFRFNYDEAILQAQEGPRTTSFDLRQPLARLGCPVLLMRANTPAAVGEGADHTSHPAHVLLADFGYQGGRIMFGRTAEMLALLGFLKLVEQGGPA